MAQTKRKKKKLSNIAVKLAAVLASAYLVVSFVSGQLQVAAKRHEYEQLTQKLEAQKLQNQELQQLMDSGDEDAYIERVAREKLGYARPNERVFVDIVS